MFSKNFIEVLETRTLMSASGALNLAVQQDRLAVQADLLKFKYDCVECQVTMLADVTAVKANDPRQATTLAPLVKKLHTDVQAMRTSLLADRLAEAKNVLADESVIVGDYSQILADHGNATALKADHAKLLADRITLQNDMIAGLDSRIATRQADYATINTDCNNIITAVQSDPNATPALQTAVAKWISDKTGDMTILLGDLQKIEADRTTLVAALTAEQNA